ncbi:LysM peptidoglycan-binding domain-containing protein [Arthrobacter sp. lap29]|uniref:LysM peptidoglycan-binding domain-containing protein n=1 Tax=Arthrobacter sp. lap29 TaxID=3056122 RepID=UPI0028F71303|nr:LysM peptidoglycan-binding domain-containing protein [Arthrobacter sp. lap29]
MTLNLNNLADVLRARGLKVVEVSGWKPRGYKGNKLVDFRGVLWHHTATPGARNPANGNMPTLNVLANGHENLAGPLSQLGLGRDGTVYVVAGGLANHAGTGSAPGIPVNAGNWHMLGVEMESSGTAPWDWTAAQLAAAPKLGAALEMAYMASLPASQRLQMGHFEYSDAGKIDPAGWPGGMDGLRNSINAQIAAWSKAPTKPAPTPSKPATAKPAPASSFVATVNRGDTLTSIATQFGTTVTAIQALNKLPKPNAIAVGQKLNIPVTNKPAVPQYCWASPGDTLSSIGKQFGVSWQNIAKLNGIPAPYVIHPQQKIRLW